jgi:hypothetical protein
MSGETGMTAASALGGFSFSFSFSFRLVSGYSPAALFYYLS